MDHRVAVDADYGRWSADTVARGRPQPASNLAGIAAGVTAPTTLPDESVRTMLEIGSDDTNALHPWQPNRESRCRTQLEADCL